MMLRVLHNLLIIKGKKNYEFFFERCEYDNEDWMCDEFNGMCTGLRDGLGLFEYVGPQGQCWV